MEPEEISSSPSGFLGIITSKLGPTSPLAEKETIPLGEEGARRLLRRTPNSYILNQIYGLWIYLSLFLLTLLITRKVSVNQYGIYAVAASAFNTIAYLVAFGLEDATTTFVPRLLAEHGQATVASLVRKLLGLRIATLALCMAILLLGLPELAVLFATIPTGLTASIAAALRSPDLQSHVAPIAFWVFANGIFSLLNAIYAAIMRLKIVFIIGGLVQLFLLALGFVTLQAGMGIDSILWIQGIGTFLGAVIFALWLIPLLSARGANYVQPLGPVLRLGISAWFTNLVSFALLKQISILLLVYFGATLAQQSYFNLSFQLTDAANILLVSGFGGVGVAALAAAFVGNNVERLSRAWQALIKIETLLSAPGLIFCLFNAPHIVTALYGPSYAAAGSLFALFLVLNIFVRVLGMTIHQSTLYVLGKSRQVVISQWVGLCVVIALGIILIPRWGPAGALVADGVSRLVTYGTMLAFLWKRLPRRYPLDYSLRLVIAAAIAAIPTALFHPETKATILAFGLLFIVLSAVMLAITRPLTHHDLEMLREVKPGIVPYLKWFARPA